MINRPPFILAFAADQQGCGYHRIMLPLASLVEAGVADARIDMPLWPDEVVAACAPDVIVWQRQVEDNQIETMTRWRKLLPKTLFVYELDDYLAEIPAFSFHASFMPRDVTSRVARGLAVCDRITTTTQPLADWLRTLAPEHAQINVVANGLPVSRLHERPVRSMGKLRIGFAGGISHAGDLELLRTAMETIGDAVTWVFFGLAIKNPPVNIEFHDGVPVALYLDKMVSLDLDLVLAPLEDNVFNRCKSNLRLIEAAAVGAAVIAQDLEPYQLCKPPVFAHVKTPLDWALAIDKFINASKYERQRSVDALRSWVGRNFTLERLLPARMEAWLPDVSVAWRPATALPSRSHRLIVASTDAALPFLTSMLTVTNGLEQACRIALDRGADLLWLRPATTFDAAGLGQLRQILRDRADVASTVPLSNDGPNGFPQLDPWLSMPPGTAATLAKLTADLFGKRTLNINTASGPVILLACRALATLGLPDVAGCSGNEEQALMEWGLRATVRGWKHVQAIGTYAGSTTIPEQPTPTAVMRLQARGLGEYLSNAPADSKLTEDERAQLELRMLRMQWGGPRPGSMGFANDYAAWSQLRAVQSFAKTYNPRLQQAERVLVRSFGAEKDWPDDSYIIFVDDTVTLQDAVFWFEKTLDEFTMRTPMVLYADNETVTNGKKAPEFKPDFDPTLFLAQDYVSSVCAVQAGLLSEVPANRIELFRVLLYIWDNYGSKAFHHVPKILGAVQVESKPETIALETVERQLVIERMLGDQVTVKASRHIIGCLTVTRNTQLTPLVSIIVPTLGSGRLIQPCVATILQHTDYANYEIIVVQNGTQRKDPDLSAEALSDPRVFVVHYDGDFNWARINNWAIREHARGSYIVTMNDDVCVGTDRWLDMLLGHAVLPDVGVVGAKLVHPMGVVQHVGVVCHNGVAGHMHKGTSAGQAGHLGRILLAHEASAVTGACMLFSRTNFEAVNGFDTSWPTNYNDTVFCLEQRKRHRCVVVETSAELLHPEASSRVESTTPEGMVALKLDNARLAKNYPDSDPYWNPNMVMGLEERGRMIRGLNADSLSWEDFTVHPDSRRVLLINDAPGEHGCVLEVLRGGGIPFMADLSGFLLRLTAPGAINVTPWDIRNADKIAKSLKMLGIDSIVLRSLVGASGAAPPVEALRVLNEARLGIPVAIQPSDLANIAPWLVEDGRQNEMELFGFVDMDAWKAAYASAIPVPRGGFETEFTKHAGES